MQRRKSRSGALRTLARALAKRTSLLDDDRGSVLVYSTVAMSVFLGFSALAIDGSFLYLSQSRAQTAADAAALAAASQLPDEVAATETAVAFAGKNLAAERYGTVLAESDVTFGRWDPGTRTFAEDVSPADAVRVAVRMSDANANPVETFFASAIGLHEVGIGATAIAVQAQPSTGLGDACLQAMEPSASDALRVVGTAEIHGTGCNIQIDSCHSTSAFNASGTPDIDLTVELAGGAVGSGEIHVCGGLSASPNVTLPPAQYVHTQTGASNGDPFDRPPFDDRPQASEAADCDNVNFSTSGNAMLWPGVYCGGLTLSGNGSATLQPGTYYIRNGPLSVTGNRALVGEGVTIVTIGADANLDLGGVSSMALSAPLTGDYAGFVFFGDRNDPATDSHKLHGTPLGAFHGIAYFPGAEIEFLGTASAGTGAGTDDCALLIADRLFFNGTVDLELAATCSDYQGTPAFEPFAAMAKLVD